MLDTFQGIIAEVNVGHLYRFFVKRIDVDTETMVLNGNIDLSRFQTFDRLV